MTPQGGHHPSCLLWQLESLLSRLTLPGTRSQGVLLEQAAGTFRDKELLVSGWSPDNSSTTLITLWSPPTPEEIKPWGQGSPAMAQVSEATERERLSPVYFECEHKGPRVFQTLFL